VLPQPDVTREQCHHPALIDDVLRNVEVVADTVIANAVGESGR
jgi:hypothetical protein